MRSLTLNLSQADRPLHQRALLRRSVFKNTDRRGINIIITDRPRFRPVLTGVDAVALRRQCEALEGRRLHSTVGERDTLTLIKRVDVPEEIVRSWRAKLEDFRKAR